jgi:DNA processing protein
VFLVTVFDLLVLSQIPGLGSQRIRSLVDHFGSSAQVSRANARDLSGARGITKPMASAVAHFMHSTAHAAAERFADDQIRRLNTIKGRIVSLWDPLYPDCLKMIYDPPPFLYVLGHMLPDDIYAVAVVGTRQPTAYGIAQAEHLVNELVALGIVIVSGLARGIDTRAHAAALKGGGRTIAVIGSGADVIYPPENTALAGGVAGSGALLTEYPLGTKPDAVNFPRRNRIISGLSLGTLVIETDLTGGAMITANIALEQNREVFALPGPVTSQWSRGCHELIKSGRAKLVERVDDLLEELSAPLRPLLAGSRTAAVRPLPEISLFEKSVFDSLGAEPQAVTDLAGASRLSAADTLANLLSLELKGLARRLPGNLFKKGTP